MVDRDEGRVRLDKWLWAARFYKTRGLAKEAIEGGKVRCQGDKCKPSKELKVGEELTLRVGYEERTVVVQGLSDVRRGAEHAQALYQETPESQRLRQQAAERRVAGGGEPQGASKPSKKQRRQIYYLRGGGGEFPANED